MINKKKAIKQLDMMIDVGGKISCFRKYAEIDYNQLKKISDTSNLDEPGIYFLLNKNKVVIYIGSTDRKLKTRLTELIKRPQDHTLFAKRVRLLLEEEFKKKITGFDAKKMKDFIGNDFLSNEKYVSIENEARSFIKKSYHYFAISDSKFANKRFLKSVEHFLIAIYDPKFNDEIKRTEYDEKIKFTDLIDDK